MTNAQPIRTSLVNRVPAALLSSPLHRMLSCKRLLLSFTGRRSGTRYATPVNYLQHGRDLLITTDSRWWHNLDGGSPVEVRLRGRQLAATAEAIRDVEQVVAALTAIVRDHPPHGRWAHIGVAADGTPDDEQVRAEVARGRVLVRVRLQADAARPA